MENTTNTEERAIVDLLSLTELNANINITVNLRDLVNLNRELIKEFKQTCEDDMRLEIGRDYLSRDKAAKLLNISLPTLWRWEEKEYLVPIRKGGRVMYRRKDIMEMMNNRESNQ